MTTPVAQPDITLRLDLSGVIHDASLANGVIDESVDDWIGRDWRATVAADEREPLGRLLAAAADGHGAASVELRQRFPSGRLLTVEYTAVRLGGDAGLIAVGRQVRAVADLEQRLMDAQRTMERDYWRLRAVETRYRLLFDGAAEALISLDAADLGILEVNPIAADLLALPSRARGAARGADLRTWLSAESQRDFERLVARIRADGSAPGVLLRLRDGGPGCLARASLAGDGGESVLMLQISLTGARPARAEAQPPAERRHDDLIERCPDGFVVIDRGGRVRRANAAFVEMAQAGSEAAVLGEPFARWLGRPGADLTVLLANIERFGRVQLFATTIRGDLDVETSVELSATGDADTAPALIAVVIRDVGRRLAGGAGRVPLEVLADALAARIGETPLRTLVDEAVAEVERHFVRAALELTAGNRTAAAQILGLSRQSLHTKLNRHRLGGGGAGLRPL